MASCIQVWLLAHRHGYKGFVDLTVECGYLHTGMAIRALLT